MKPPGPPPVEHLRRMWPAYLILTASLLGVWALGRQLRTTAENRRQTEFEAACWQIKDRAEIQFTFHLALLSGIRGLFAASADVRPEEFGRYLASLDISPGAGGSSPGNVPGMRDLGFALRVPHAGRDAHTALLRANGFTNYSPYFASHGPDHFPIVYVDDFSRNGTGVSGWDLAWDPVRLATVRRACESGSPMATPPLEIHARDPAHRTRGFILYFPVYSGGTTPATVEERRERLIGTAFASFEDESLWGVVRGTDQQVADLAMFDGRTYTDPHRIFPRTPPALSQRKPEYSSGFTAEAFGRTWGFYFSSRPEFEDQPGRLLPILVQGVGSMVAIGLFALTWGILRARWSAERMAREIQASESRFRRIFETAQDVYYRTDLDGHLQLVSPSLTRLLGYGPEEVLGGDVTQAYVDASCRGKILERLLADGRIADFELALRHKDGRVIHASITAQLVRDDAGQPVGSEGTIRDISARKETEAERLRSSNLESLGLLAGGIAHDFNNILTSVLGNVALARMDPSGSRELGESLGEIESAALRARGLTHQLLTFAKGGAPLRQAASLPEIIRESIGFALRGSRVRHDFLLDDALWPAEVDATQLHQVLHNIALNAVQAMPEGGRFTVRARNLTSAPVPDLPPGPYIHCSLEDTGVGISPGDLPRIFDPYFTTRKDGTGLGLASAYSIIRRHEGRLAVESVPGKGTTFHIWLPASPAAVVPANPATSSAPLRPNAGTGERVLVVDDEGSIRSVLARHLASLGYQAVTVTDGCAAIERVREDRAHGLPPFAAAVLDLTIPGGMGGQEALPRLRALQPSLRAIVSSGYSSDPVMANPRRHGFDGVLPKPYQVQDLERVLNLVLGQAAAGHPDAAAAGGAPPGQRG